MSCQFIRWTTPRSIITSGSLGTMGFGLPSAIGAQVANPDKTVVLVRTRRPKRPSPHPHTDQAVLTGASRAVAPTWCALPWCAHVGELTCGVLSRGVSSRGVW
eukprot:1512761-Prymnesium_polylepis.1